VIAAGISDARDLRDVVSLILNVGLTPGELLWLEWADVSFDKGLITVRSMTGKPARLLHFGEKVCLMLDARAKRVGSPGFVLGAAPSIVLGRVSRQLRALSEYFCANIVTLVAVQHAFAKRVLDSLSDANFRVPVVDCRYVPPRGGSVRSRRHHLVRQTARPRVENSS
jgi:integrase